MLPCLLQYSGSSLLHGLAFVVDLICGCGWLRISTFPLWPPCVHAVATSLTYWWPFFMALCSMLCVLHSVSPPLVWLYTFTFSYSQFSSDVFPRCTTYSIYMVYNLAHAKLYFVQLAYKNLWVKLLLQLCQCSCICTKYSGVNADAIFFLCIV